MPETNTIQRTKSPTELAGGEGARAWTTCARSNCTFVLVFSLLLNIAGLCSVSGVQHIMQSILLLWLSAGERPAPPVRGLRWHYGWIRNIRRRSFDVRLRILKINHLQKNHSHTNWHLRNASTHVCRLTAPASRRQVEFCPQQQVAAGTI